MSSFAKTNAPSRGLLNAGARLATISASAGPAMPRMLERARAVIQFEAMALMRLSKTVDAQLCILANHILSSDGAVVVSGVGKSRLVGEKISATLASTGTPSIVLDPLDAIHGDLGRLRCEDTLLLLSKSGETEELIALIRAARRLDVAVAVMTASDMSSLAKMADVVLCIGSMQEACALGLAPTTTTTAMMALGDALAIVMQERRGFGRRDFAHLHPGGSLGRGLMRVRDFMCELDRVPVVTPDTPLSQVLTMMCGISMKSKTAVVVDARSRLLGTISANCICTAVTDGDQSELRSPVAKHMTRPIATIGEHDSVIDAERIFRQCGQELLPVMSGSDRLIGVLAGEAFAQLH